MLSLITTMNDNKCEWITLGFALLGVYKSEAGNVTLYTYIPCLEPEITPPPPTPFFGVVRVAHLFIFCVVLLCVFMF